MTMNTRSKEKLIELVKQYKCIYMFTHRDYKNCLKKKILWEQIGASVGVPGLKAKEIWRTLRDSYIRHKKSVEGKLGSTRKYLNYAWSSQMSFLDESLEGRLNGNKTSLEYLDPLESPLFESVNIEPSTSTHPPPLSPDFQYTQPTTSNSLRSSSPCLSKRKSDCGLDNTEQVNDCLRYKKKKQWDSADYLFMSYAKSFKKLSVRKQCKIKVEIAKLFANAELDESENSSTNELSSPVIFMPLSYSDISHNSANPTQTMLLNSSLEVKQE